MKQANIFLHDKFAGVLTEDENGYTFQYDEAYFIEDSSTPISLTFPINPEVNHPFTSDVLFPFFDGLIPEGWLLDVAERSWKINPKDRMGLLMSCCKDCIGAVSVQPKIEEDEA